MAAPVCNHASGIGKENIGYTQGVLFDGTPFEAELWEQGELNCLSVILPAKEGFAGDSERLPCKTSHRKAACAAAAQGNLAGIHYTKGEGVDHSVLPIGMVLADRKAQQDETEKYVEYLREMGIVRFLSNLRDGYVCPMVDIEGHDVVQVIITLCDEDQDIATTGLRFMSFRETDEPAGSQIKRVK